MIKGLLFIVLSLPLLLTAQVDSVNTLTPGPDSLALSTPRLYWYDIKNEIHGPKDSVETAVYRKGDEHGLNYTDFGDFFREEALWFNFDLNESGRPVYLAPVQLYPHQTAFRYGGVLMNNPTYGMFNGQFLSAVNLLVIETDGILGSVQSMGMAGTGRINVTPFGTHKEMPWTRIVFKQGVFGFSMLDVSFGTSFSDKFSIQLGGFNNLYDGTLITANHKGNNFRAEMAWQYADNLFIRGQIFLDRHRIGLAQYEIQNEVALPKVYQTQDNYTVDLTWHPSVGEPDRLHTVIFASSYFQELRDENYKPYFIEYENTRYGFDTNYKLHLDNIAIVAGAGSQYANVWGIPYAKTYHPFAGDLYATADIELLSGFELSAGGSIAMKTDFSPQWSGFAAAHINMAENQSLHIQAGRAVRFPVTSELYFNFDSLYGNPDLHPEEHLRLEAEYTLHDQSEWQFTFSGGVHQVLNEIIWQDQKFYNELSTRQFAFSGLKAGFSLWRINLTAGGQYSFTDTPLTPRSSFWGKIHYHDIWLDGALVLDLYGMFHFYDQHKDIFFDPRIDRFSRGQGTTNAYSLLNWKAMATIQEAMIFFEMDNSLSSDYVVIRGYDEFYIRWRFGVDWILWD